MKLLVILAVVGIATAQLAHHRPIQVQLMEAQQHRPIQIQTPPIQIIHRDPNVDERQWPQPEHPIAMPEYPAWNWQHEQPINRMPEWNVRNPQPIQPIQPLPEFEGHFPRLPPWANRQPEPEPEPEQPSWNIELPNWSVNIQRPQPPQPEPEHPVANPRFPQFPQFPQPEEPIQRPQGPMQRPQPVPQPEPIQRPQFPVFPQQPQQPQPEPIQRPQFPVFPQQPQQPQPEPTQRPQFPVFPQQPIQRPQFPVHPPVREPIRPRANWREGQFDERCPVVNDHEGIPFFLPGNGQWAFFMCWNRIAFPFDCPDGTVFRNEVNVCADPGWEPQMRPYAEE